MKLPKRKPIVVAIKGSTKPDVVSQGTLKKIADLQGALWKAERAAHLAVEELRTRLLYGASVEPGPLVFDPELKMVRRRQGATGST